MLIQKLGNIEYISIENDKLNTFLDLGSKLLVSHCWSLNTSLRLEGILFALEKLIEYLKTTENEQGAT